jgi:hypothetical protein
VRTTSTLGVACQQRVKFDALLGMTFFAPRNAPMIARVLVVTAVQRQVGHRCKTRVMGPGFKQMALRRKVKGAGLL